MRELARILGVVALVGLWACADARDAMGSISTGVDADDESGGGDDGDDADAGELFDVGEGQETAGDGGGEQGCQKIDFLFVIDNSSSMSGAQDSLAASFPGFIEAIEADVAGDHHIMVVDTDDEPVHFCENGCAEQGVPVHHLCQDYTCGSVDTLEACDVTIGAGVVRPLGGMASNQECGIVDGRRFMDQSQPDLAGTFACAGKVGVSGAGNERNVTSMLRALTDHAQPGGCNEGFLRDDAILVVTIVSNADTGTAGEELNPGDPIEVWRDSLLAVKAGNPDAVVVIGFLKDSLLPPTGRKYADFVRLFGVQGYVGDVATDDYSELFAQAVGGISEACENFTPPG